MADAAARDAVWIDVLPSMRNFGSELAKGASKEADVAGKGIGKRFGTALLAGTAVVGGGAALAVKALYNIGATFDDVADTIRVGTGATGKNLDGLVASAKKVGTQIPASFEDIGTTIADVNTRLGLTGPTLEKLSKQILEAGRLTNEAINIKDVTGAFSAFGVKGKATTKAMDDLFQVSQATGVGMNELSQRMSKQGTIARQLGFTFKDTASFLGIMDKAGVDGNAVMSSMQRGLVNLAKDGEKPAAAFKRVTKQIQGFVDKGDDAKALDLAGKVFGTRGAGQFISALKSGKVNIDNMSKSAGLSGDSIMKASKDTMDFSEQWQLFKNNVLVKIEPIASRVFGLISKGMQWLVEHGIPAVQGFVDGFKDGTGAGGKFADILRGVADRAKRVVGFLRENRDVIEALAVGLGVALVALGTYNAYVKVSSVVTKAWSVAQRILNGTLKANPIGLVITAIGLLVAGFVLAYKKSETFRKIVDAAWAGIKKAALAVVGWFQRTAWPILKQVFGFIGNAIKTVAVVYFKVYSTAIKKAFDGASTGIRWAWNHVIKPTFDAVKGAVGKVRDAFGAAKRGISKVWGGLTDAVKGPITAVLSFIRDRFLRPLQNLINKIPGVHLNLFGDAAIPRVSSFKSTGSSGNMYASGGVLPGYTPGRDVHDFYSPTGGRLSLSGGEAIMRPEFTRAVGGARGVARLNALARKGQAFAAGGIWDKIKGYGAAMSVIPGLPGFAGNAVMDVDKAISGVKNLGSGILSKLGGNMFGRAAFGAGKLAVNGLVSLVKKAFASGNGPAGPKSHGSWSQLWSMVQGLDPAARLFSGYRPGARTATGFLSGHALGKAIDVSPDYSLWRKLWPMRNRFRELYGPWGGWLLGKDRHAYPGAALTLGNHKDHIHIRSYADGGVMKPLLFDRGGYLPQGTSLVHNATGKPEPLRRADESGPAVANNYYGPVGFDPKQLAREQEQRWRDSMALAGLRGV